MRKPNPPRCLRLDQAEAAPPGRPNGTAGNSPAASALQTSLKTFRRIVTGAEAGSSEFPTSEALGHGATISKGGGQLREQGTGPIALHSASTRAGWPRSCSSSCIGARRPGAAPGADGQGVNREAAGRRGAAPQHPIEARPPEHAVVTHQQQAPVAWPLSPRVSVQASSSASSSAIGAAERTRHSTPLCSRSPERWPPPRPGRCEKSSPQPRRRGRAWRQAGGGGTHDRGRSALPAPQRSSDANRKHIVLRLAAQAAERRDVQFAAGPLPDSPKPKIVPVGRRGALRSTWPG